MKTSETLFTSSFEKLKKEILQNPPSEQINSTDIKRALFSPPVQAIERVFLFRRKAQRFLEATEWCNIFKCSKNLNALNVMPIVIQSFHWLRLIFNYLDWLTVNSTRMKWNHFHLSNDFGSAKMLQAKEKWTGSKFKKQTIHSSTMFVLMKSHLIKLQTWSGFLVYTT